MVHYWIAKKLQNWHFIEGKLWAIVCKVQNLLADLSVEHIKMCLLSSPPRFFMHYLSIRPGTCLSCRKDFASGAYNFQFTYRFLLVPLDLLEAIYLVWVKQKIGSFIHSDSFRAALGVDRWKLLDFLLNISFSLPPTFKMWFLFPPRIEMMALHSKASCCNIISWQRMFP